MTTSAMLILHGKQATNTPVRQAVLALRDAGHNIAVRVTWEADDVARYVQEAVEGGLGTVIAGGGDGSICHVVDALMRSGSRETKLAILPLGTANDFATAAGIPETPTEALALLENAPTPVDVIQVNDSYFLNMATGGFGTEVTSQTPEDLKDLLGGAAYLFTGLSRFSGIRAAQGRLSGPDFRWEGEFLALGLGNGQQAGGGQRLCPDARINDGLLDIAVLPADVDIFASIRDWFDGNSPHERLFQRARVRNLLIETDNPMNLNLDGEPLEDRRFELSVLPDALSLHLPVDCPLLSAR